MGNYVSLDSNNKIISIKNKTPGDKTSQEQSETNKYLYYLNTDNFTIIEMMKIPSFSSNNINSENNSKVQQKMKKYIEDGNIFYTNIFYSCFFDKNDKNLLEMVPSKFPKGELIFAASITPIYGFYLSGDNIINSIIIIPNSYLIQDS